MHLQDLQHEVGGDGEEGPGEVAPQHPGEGGHLIVEEEVQQVGHRQAGRAEQKKQKRHRREVGA